jgi:hypothetical protein
VTVTQVEAKGNELWLCTPRFLSKRITSDHLKVYSDSISDWLVVDDMAQEVLDGAEDKTIGAIGGKCLRILPHGRSPFGMRKCWFDSRFPWIKVASDFPSAECPSSSIRGTLLFVSPPGGIRGNYLLQFDRGGKTPSYRALSAQTQIHHNRFSVVSLDEAPDGDTLAISSRDTTCLWGPWLVYLLMALAFVAAAVLSFLEWLSYVRSTCVFRTARLHWRQPWRGTLSAWDHKRRQRAFVLQRTAGVICSRAAVAALFLILPWQEIWALTILAVAIFALGGLLGTRFPRVAKAILSTLGVVAIGTLTAFLFAAWPAGPFVKVVVNAVLLVSILLLSFLSQIA